MTTVVLPAAHPSVEVAAFDTEFVVFDPRVNRVHHVRDLAAVVWDACDGRTTTAELSAEICDVTGLDPAAVATAVAAALALFSREGLLEGTEPVSPPPCIGCADEGPRPTGRRRGKLRR